MDIPDDLASAMRKSWSESLDPSSLHPMTDSPIGTPGGTPKASIGGSTASGTSSPVDYQLLKHHYAISDDGRKPSLQEGLRDVLEELEFSKQPRPQAVRRGSIEDASKLRQWLNPRSSFSGASSNEPPGVTLLQSKCWVTVVETPEDLPLILVLNHSIKASCSRFKLYVLYMGELSDVGAELSMHGVEVIRVEDISPILIHPSGNATRASPDSARWCKLAPFLSLTNSFDLICYLSPRSVVLANIDELLESQAVADEIDNETCVLLSNSMERSPTTVVLRPNEGVEACIREYMTVYVNAGYNDKWNKLQTITDLEVLKELFQDSWGVVAAEYCHAGRGPIPSHTRVVEVGARKPWLVQSNDDVTKLWNNIWRVLNNQTQAHYT
ncbi:LAFE_0G05160g1_1 [Lachancea fermentati]|uniref:LAFE_0G05160g1_1 n=1 Tax=Lachancea fermentati TaxID=4955 RepID=A0A1G4MH57_LACFM|nr:LAFE_0G05160g1_1 [Lachancea fermentati]